MTRLPFEGSSEDTIWWLFSRDECEIEISYGYTLVTGDTNLCFFSLSEIFFNLICLNDMRLFNHTLIVQSYEIEQ